MKASLPTSIRTLVPYLERHPRVLANTPEFGEHERLFLEYRNQRLYFGLANGAPAFCPLFACCNDDSEVGVTFHEQGFALHIHGNKMTYQYLDSPFQLGALGVSSLARETMCEVGVEPSTLFFRHAKGDWGDLTAHDKQANLAALVDGSRLLSAYEGPWGKAWVITEAENEDGRRERTTVLLPTEY